MNFCFSRMTCSAAIASMLLMAAPTSAAPGKGEADTDSSDGNTVKVARVEDGSDSTVDYNLEVMGPYTIKYESIGNGLGEDGADQTDTFTFDLNGAGAVSVKTKADITSAYSYLWNVGDTHMDDQGFEVTLVSRTADSITVTIRSAGNESALSHVEFSLPDMASQYD